MRNPSPSTLVIIELSCLLQVEKKKPPKAKGQNKRSTKAELLFRQDGVYSMLCDGLSRSNILLFAAEHWSVSERTADEYIRNARDRLHEDSSISREALMAEAFAAYRQIRQSAEKRGQCLAALKAVENMTNLAGLGK